MQEYKNMEEKCAFCKGSLSVPCTTRLLESHVIMIELILENITFDKEFFIGSQLCQVCWKNMVNFYEFKSNFLNTENELNQNITRKQSTLYQVLVTMGKIEHPAKIVSPFWRACRICFNSLKAAEYRDLKTCETRLSKALTACLPNISMSLTTDTDICQICYHKLLHYACLIRSYNYFIKSKQGTEEVDLLSDDVEPLEKKSKLDKDETLSSNNPGLYRKAKIDRRKIPRDIFDRFVGNTSKKADRRKSHDRFPKKATSDRRTVLNIMDIDDITEDQYYECQCCLGPFKTKFELLRDFKQHRKSLRTCPICGRTFVSFTVLRRHLFEHGVRDIYRVVSYDSEDEPFSPRKEISDVSATNAATTSTNSNVPVEKPRKKRGRKPSRLPERLELGADDIKDITLDEYYECQCCLGNFRTKPELMNDFENHHKNLRTCRVCGNVFTSFPLLREHFLEHGIKDLYKIVTYDSEDEPVPPIKEISNSSTTNAKTNSEQQPSECSSSTTTCPDCRQSFDSLSDYVSHCCQSKATLPKCSPLRDIEVEEELRCGHCSCVFYSFDDLEEHECTPLFADGDKKTNFDEDLDLIAQQLSLIKDRAKQTMSDSELAEKQSKLVNLKKRLRQYFLDKVKLKRRKDLSEAVKMTAELADMLGEKPEQNADGLKEKVFECIGCRAGCVDEKDLMFHMNYCRKVFRCTCCDYKTIVPPELQLHSSEVHGLLLYYCPHCPFVTLMAKNYEDHLAGHVCPPKDNTGNDYTSENEKRVNCSESFEFSSMSLGYSVENVIKIEASQNEFENECKIEISDCDLKEEPCDFIDATPESQINDQTISNTTSIEPECIPKNNTNTSAMSIATVPDSSTSTPMHPRTKESEVFVIDSDSDSEFVESVERRISSVAAQAEEVCTVTASQASKLISEGIPVVTEASLIMLPNIPNSNLGIMNFITDRNLKESSNEEIMDVTTDNSETISANSETISADSETISADSETDYSTFPKIEFRENAVNNDEHSILISDSEDEEDIFTESCRNYKLEDSIPSGRGYDIDGSNSSATSKPNLVFDDEENQIVAYTIIWNDEGDNSETVQNGDEKLKTEEAPLYPEDDCTFMPQYTHVQMRAPSVKPAKSSSIPKTRMPPNALHLFSSEVKDKIKSEYPNLSGKVRRQFILDTWRNMPETEKWSYKEAARLQKKLFIQENPDLLPPSKQKVKKAAVVDVSVSDDTEEILSD